MGNRALIFNAAVALGGLLLMTCRPSMAEPSGVACHVKVQGGPPGVVLVQTEDLIQGKKSAGNATVRQDDGTSLPVEAVLECIQFPKGGRFADPFIQIHFEKMDK